MNFKKILLGSAIAVGTFGFFACGGDSGSDPVVGPDGTPPAGDEINIPVQSTLSPVVVSNLSITPMSNGNGGMMGALGGTIKLDPDFMDNTQPYTANVSTLIDSVRFTVGRVINGKPYEEKININLDGTVFPTEMVSFAQKNLEFSALSTCGEFQLYIFVYSSSKEEGIKTSLYTTVIDSLKFTRPETECKAPEPIESSSSAAAVCTPTTVVYDTLTNAEGSGKTALNFETGTADNPHVTLKFSDGLAYLNPAAGAEVYEDNAQVSGLLPDKNPVCKEDFARAGRAYTDELMSGLWLDVVAADGKMYSLMVQKVMKEAGSKTKGSIYLVYYK